MSDETMRGFLRAFCDALLSQDTARIAASLHDDIDWLIYGPVDLFPFFGQRKGKQAVVSMLAQLDGYLKLQRCEKDSSLIDDAQSAVLTKLIAICKRSGRTMSLRLALFIEVRDDKVNRLRMVFDSFDAAEQALGREIDLTRAA